MLAKVELIHSLNHQTMSLYAKEQNLTDAEECILAFVLGYYSDNKVGPTIEEIRAFFKEAKGISLSDGGVHYYMTKLIAKGRLKKTRRSGWRNLAPITAE